MNQNMSVQVVLGALLHDIGKFFERAELLGEYRKDPEKEQAYCPRRPEGYYSHKHVLHTLRFCELLEERVPALSPPQGSDQNWIAFAARHHVGSSALERLVAAADHFASAEREKGLYYERRIHQKTRLESLLERVNGHEPVAHRLPLRVVSMDKEALYPRRLDTFKPAMTEHAFHEGPFDRVAISPDHLPLVAEYKVMATGMLEDLERLPSPPQHGVDGVYSVIRGMLALLEKYLVTVPAATNVCHPDISLYDHLRVTAAIGEGLYHWHESWGDLETANFEEQNTAKWRLVCGDFSGIQRFIYSITSKGAAKGLRGRSFFVQLLCDAVSERLLHRLGLSACCRIYSSGGKFFLLIPANLEETLRTEADAINQFLFKQFGGDVFLGIGVAQVHGEDFRGGNMGPRWKEAASLDLERDRQRRFAGIMAADESFFDPHEPHRSGGHCEVCGRDDANVGLDQEGERTICASCSDLERIGRRLADAHGIFWAWGQERKTVQSTLGKQADLKFPALELDLYLLLSAPELRTIGALTGCQYEVMNQGSFLDGNPQGYSCGARYLARWDRMKRSGDWEFDEFAKAAEGIERLGVLRMDVDNLGQVFIRGLRFGAAEKEMGSLSRMATLSRQLGMFFSGHLMELLRDYEKTQVIYAGGDDLFLIGSWDELPRVADSIRRAFSEYTASNPAFSLSGGMVLVSGKYPISRSAELAGGEEERAKRLEWGKGRTKSAFSLLDTAVPWQDWEAVTVLKEKIGAVAESNRAIIDRLRSVVLALQEYERRNLGQLDGMDTESIREVRQWQRWRWQLVYNLHRMVKRDSSLEQDIETIQRALLQDVVGNFKPVQHVIDWLQLPLRWAELETRRER